MILIKNVGPAIRKRTDPLEGTIQFSLSISTLKTGYKHGNKRSKKNNKRRGEEEQKELVHLDRLRNK